MSTERLAARRWASTGSAEPLDSVAEATVDELDTYARAAAGLASLEIDEAWWPGVLLHLRVLLDNAAIVEAIDTTEASP